MTNASANIERLNYAIATLNDDAEDMHSLISRSTDELKRATQKGEKVAELASAVADSLGPLSEKLQNQIGDTAVLLKEAKSSTEEQVKAISKGFDDLKGEMAASSAAQREALADFGKASLQASDETREALQADYLAYKTAVDARLDQLDGAVAKLAQAVSDAGQVASNAADELKKKVMLPLYGTVAVAVLQVVTIVLLLVR